jgi:membrane protease YdiL (CAAX protease family)
MLVALRHALGLSLAGLDRFGWQRDPILLLGREGRWRLPWVLFGLAVCPLVFGALLVSGPLAFETAALHEGWIVRKFSTSSSTFPFEPAQPLSYVHEVLTWLPLLLAPLIVLRVVHGVSWRRGFSYGNGFRWLDFCRAAAALLVVLAPAAALTYYLEPQQHQWRWPGIAILPWIALGLGALLVQTLAEDVFFLGYLHRTWGAVLAFRLPAAAAVTAVFVLPHLFNADVQRDMLLGVIDHAINTVIAIAVLLRTQNLAASAGLHWANNAFILLRPTGPEQVSPLALIVYTDPVYAAGGSYLYDPITLAGLIAGPALLLTLLFWRRSPLRLAKAPVELPAVGSPAAPGADRREAEASKASPRVLSRLSAGLALLMWRRDPVLLLGREGRWRWPWVLAGGAAIMLLSFLLFQVAFAFENYALRQGWISRTPAGVVFPFEPAEPASYVNDLLSWLPWLLPPLIALRIVHGVSWRRAFSYGNGFRWLDFCRAASALLLLIGVAAALTYLLEPQQHQVRWPGTDALPWIALGLCAILVQTLGEDVLYLGYLHRTLGAVLAIRLPVAAAVTALFIVPHLANSDIQRDMLLGVVGLAVMTVVSIAVLLRTQNLAASAGLHWANNAFILLRPGAPEEVTPLALVVYTDPVYAAGGSHLYDPATYFYTVAGLTLLLVLLMWRRSPFCLPKAPPPVASAGHRPPATAETVAAAPATAASWTE